MNRPIIFIFLSFVFLLSCSTASEERDEEIPTTCGEVTLQAPREVEATDGVYSDKVSLTWEDPFFWGMVTSTEETAGAFGSLAIDSNMTLHAVYNLNDPTLGHLLMHASKTTDGCWETQLIAADNGWYTDIDIASDNTPHVSYYDSTNNTIKHASRDPEGSWSFETVDTSVINSLGSTSIAVATDGSLHIVYKGSDGLRHASKANVSASWETEVISSTMGQYAAINNGFGDTL